MSQPGPVVAAAAALAFALSTPAEAAPVARPTPAEGLSRIAPVLPTFTLSGATSGKGSIEVGADIIAGLSKSWDLSVAPSVSVASNAGSASLLAHGSNSVSWNPAWQLELVATLIELGVDFRQEETKGGSGGRIRAEAHARCVAACDDLGPEYDKTFCDGVSRQKQMTALLVTARSCLSQTGLPEDCSRIEPFTADVAKRAAARIARRALDCSVEQATCDGIRRDALLDAAEQTLKSCGDAKPLCKWLGDRARRPDIGIFPASDSDPLDFCPAGRTLLSSKFDTPRRDDRGRFPRWTISAGLGYGANLYRYLDGPEGGSLSPSSKTRSSVTAGASLTYVQPGGGRLTLEVPVLFTSAWSASSTLARWCVPLGQVPREAPSVGSDPASSCDERPYGAPTHAGELWAAVLLGVVDKPDGLWRLSVGPTFAYPIEGKAQYRVGIQAPVHVNLASFPREYTGSYRLLARIVPTVELFRDDAGTGVKGGVAVQLVGARNLFGRAMDWP